MGGFIPPPPCVCELKGYRLNGATGVLLVKCYEKNGLAAYLLDQACPTYCMRAFFCPVRLFNLRTSSFKTFFINTNFLVLLLYDFSSEHVFEKYKFDLQKQIIC